MTRHYTYISSFFPFIWADGKCCIIPFGLWTHHFASCFCHDCPGLTFLPHLSKWRDSTRLDSTLLPSCSLVCATSNRYKSERKSNEDGHLQPSFLPFKHWFFFNQCFLLVYPVTRNKKVRLFRVVKPLLLLILLFFLPTSYVYIRLLFVVACLAFGGYHDS